MENSIQQKQKQPAGLYLLFATEMWERFSYYALRGLFVLYLTEAILFAPERATSWYGSFTGLIYLSPLIGGYIADKWWGQRKAIIAGAILIALGQFVMGYDASLWCIYTAIILIVLGNGFFKPNISTMVGELYEKNDPRRDGGFTIFYMGINLGSLISNIVAGALAYKYGWRYGFWAAGVGMILGLIIFLWGKDKYLKGIGMGPKKPETDSSGKEIERKPLSKEDWQKIAVIFILAAFSICFFTLFEQKGAALNLYARDYTNRVINIFGWVWEMPPNYFQSFNPLFIILFAPIFSKLWVSLGAKGKDPSIPGKFMIAFWLMAIGYAILLVAAMQLGPGVKMNMMFLIGAYFFFTLGELCLSPVGLSMVTKLSPVQFVSFLMGVWFLANAAANKLAGFYSGFLYRWPHEKFFAILAIAAVVSSIVLMVLIKPIKKWMHGVK
ncbi:proton-dependent oligopeptide transporter [Parelusimicrobium proximum]|uniref:peptide MFS transporter n=1 Tax=Parelusimicrobium proximum TaxID=3228953 RepID=UPI003D16F2BB